MFDLINLKLGFSLEAHKPYLMLYKPTENNRHYSRDLIEKCFNKDILTRKEEK